MQSGFRQRPTTPPFQPDDQCKVDALLLGSGDDWAAAYPEADAERMWGERNTEHAAMLSPYDFQLNQPEARAHHGSYPAELTERPQWVLWRHNRKGSKLPVHVDGSCASSTDPSTWTTFDRALAAFRSGGRRFAGIGYVFTADDPYTGIDLDDVIVDGRIIPEAQAIVDAMHSYAEFSPSGTGIKLWVRGSVPHNLTQKMPDGWQIEVYDQRRYFTVTGEHVPGTPTDILPAHKALALLYERLRPARSTLPAVPRTHMDVDDDRARRYALAALAGEQQKVLAAQPGERHPIRYSAACRLGSFVPILSEQEIFDALAVNFGPDRYNAKRTIRDGIERGRQNPATIPAPRTIPEKLATPRVDRTPWHDELTTDAATAQFDDPRDAEIARLRRELAASEQRRRDLEAWRRWLVTVLRKPSKQLSANDKLTAIALRPEMEYRKSAGISEAHPLYIEAACANTGASPGTYGASLRNLADAGAIERREVRDSDTGNTRILIRPLLFDTPEDWSTRETRNHGGKRSKKPAEPAPVCTACEPDAPTYTQVTTTTAYICGGCGDVVDEHEHVSKLRRHPSSCTMSSAEQRSPTAPTMPAIDRPTSERSDQLPRDADPSTPTPHRAATPNTQVAARPTAPILPLSVKMQPRPRDARRRPP